MNLDERLKDLRKKKGKTQLQMSKDLSISIQSINKWVNGKCLPDAINLLNIAVYFDVSLDYLMNHEVLVKKKKKEYNFNWVKKFILSR